MRQFLYGVFGGLIMISATAFAVMYVTDYKRDRDNGLRMSTDEIVDKYSSRGRGDLDRMYDVYYDKQLEKEKKEKSK